jgi:formamidopyrimidine-DNA glycosylase
MPELPEVETIRRGLLPHISGKIITQVIIHNDKLRWPIPSGLPTLLTGSTILDITRRSKYLLLKTSSGTLIIHFGMTGSLQRLLTQKQLKTHDHVSIYLSDNSCLRFHDPRQFGAMLWTLDNPLQHKLLATIGPEPLEQSFTPEYLHEKAKNRKTAIKLFLMDSHVVAGVGNIYANEALFLAKIHPQTKAHNISIEQLTLLVKSVKEVLTFAIEKGGTTLHDFINSEGKPGYFSSELKIYGRTNKPCLSCGSKIEEMRLGQRSTFYCPKCQSLQLLQH